MNRGINVLLLSMAVLSSVAPLAQTASIGQTDGTGAKNPAASATPAPTTLSVRGTIGSYDPLTRTLSLSTSNGTVQLAVSPTTRIRRGSSKAEPAELQALTGDRATVRYTEGAGWKAVESIHVFEEKQRRVR